MERGLAKIEKIQTGGSRKSGVKSCKAARHLRAARAAISINMSALLFNRVEVFKKRKYVAKHARKTVKKLLAHVNGASMQRHYLQTPAPQRKQLERIT